MFPEYFGNLNYKWYNLLIETKYLHADLQAYKFRSRQHLYIKTLLVINLWVAYRQIKLIQSRTILEST